LIFRLQRKLSKMIMFLCDL